MKNNRAGGSGKPRTWILLRGLGREQGHWGPFSDIFASNFPDDEVLMIDLPGAGEFRDLTSPRDMNGIFQFVRAQAIERTKAQAQFCLVSISLGAMVALEWLKQRPDDLSGCVLINSSSKAVSPIFHRLRWQVWRKFLSLITITSPREREKAIIELVINSEAARERALPLWYRLAVERPIRYINFTNQLLAASRFKTLPAHPDVPMLILCGLGDRFVDPSCSILMHEKMKWPVEKHPWGGHDLTWDDPQWVTQKIRSWSEASAISLDGGADTSNKL